MKKRALLIGVNKYQTLGQLSFARQDAEAFADTLCEHYGFSRHDINLMTCRAEGTGAAFSRYLELAISDLVAYKDLDLLVFGFWGHGFSPQPGKRYLCGLETIIDDLERTAVSMDVIKAKLSQVGAENTLLVLDCCQNKPTGRSGEAETLSLGAEAELSSLARDIQTARREASKMTVPTVAVLNSCREGQRAYEWKQREHGIFTAYLLDQMKLPVSSVAQLSASIFDPVTQTAMNLHRQEQTPFVVIEGKGDIVLPVKAYQRPLPPEHVVADTRKEKSAQTPSESELLESIRFDYRECQRALMQGKGSKAYIEQVYESRLTEWKKGADLDFLEAQWLLARCYQEGLGVKKNLNQAMRIFKKAADRGHAAAQYSLGLMYDDGKGVSQDKSEAVKWYRKAAEQGHATAQYNLSLMYDEGEGVSQDKSEAVKWYRKAAEQGHVKAQFNLGLMYANGEGVTQDKSKAVKWYRKAADQGDVSAQFYLGLMYSNGEGVSQDKSKAVKWYRKAADQGEEAAQFNLGLMYSRGEGVSQDESEAVKWCRKSADQGYAAAQCVLGIRYDKGDGVSQDESEAVKWYCKSADQGYVEAQYNLGLMYYNGEGVTQDKSEAVKWYRKAAKQGYAEAQCNLGVLYIWGEGVCQHKSEAVKWFRKAADQGYAAAQYYLGLVYSRGDGVSQDKSEAVKWYRKSADQGYAEAQRALKNSKGGCFLTTAVCGVLGKPDDCHELNILRKLRDTFMQETPEREAEVEEYYEIAPLIIERIESLPDAEVIWKEIADKYILPCVHLADSNNPAGAYRLYRKMVEELKQKYMVTRNFKEFQTACLPQAGINRIDGI